MDYEPEDVTTWRFQRVSAIGMAASVLLHATVAVALLPGLLPPRETRITEQAVELTLELSSPPLEVPSVAGAEAAARKVAPGSSELAPAAPERGPEDAAAAPPPTPNEPDVALILPSIEPPPAVSLRDFGAGASPPAAEPNLAQILPPAAAPPAVDGREFAMTAPPAVAKSRNLQEHREAPQPQQVVRQAPPKRAPQQEAGGTSNGTARDNPSPVARTAPGYSHQRAQQDYLLQIVRKLSQSRFYPRSREESERGVVVARLTVARDGRLVDVSLARSSGSADLDRNVMETIRRASPFAPMPAEIGAEGHTFIVPINYTREQ